MSVISFVKDIMLPSSCFKGFHYKIKYRLFNSFSLGPLKLKLALLVILILSNVQATCSSVKQYLIY